MTHQLPGGGARGRRRLWSSCAVAVAIITTSGAPAAVANPVAPVVVRDCSGRAQVRPTEIDSIYCGAAGIIVGDITWRTWGPALAGGSGTERRLVCRAACARRVPISYGVAIRLSTPRDGEFTRISLFSRHGPAEDYPLIGPLLS